MAVERFPCKGCLLVIDQRLRISLQAAPDPDQPAAILCCRTDNLQAHILWFIRTRGYCFAYVSTAL